MAARRQTESQITRQDILDAVNSLKTQILDPNTPSLLTEVRGLKTQINEHSDRVEAIAQDFAEFKVVYAADRGKVKGYLAAVGTVAGAAGAAIKHFLFPDIPSK